MPDNTLPTPQSFESFLEHKLKTLPGGLVIWIFFVLEMATFSLFFLGFAWAYRSEPEIFMAAQKHLHPGLGSLNTAVLLTGSWLAVRGLRASRQGHSLRPWFWGTGISGLVFLGIKILEYQELFALRISLSSNAFWFYYLFLTVLHNLHVVVGVGFMFYLGLKFKLPARQPEQEEQIAAAAIYWHLVDMIWVFLFPLLYFAR